MKNKKVTILNILVDSVSVESILTKDLSGFVVTPNLDHLVKLQSDKLFYQIYRSADWVFCDSRYIWLFSKLFNTPIKEVITGSDLFPNYCLSVASVKKNNKKIFILGGTTKLILEKAVNNLNSLSEINYVVDSCSPPFGFENDKSYMDQLIYRINKSKANVLAIGLGAPKQEKIYYLIKDQLLDIKLTFAIGATIDFISGDLKRAPYWIKKIGMEWFYRMCLDPKRLIKRYLIEDLPVFILFIKQKFGLYKDPFLSEK
tara:strand:+ start:636 stop:1409 length:774 start_codon:yes stop_codon:yes gene_type:complete